MSSYLLINIAVIAVPLILSFEKKLKFYRNIPYFIISFLIAGVLYIVWDIYAAASGHWYFNPDKVIGLYIFGLPLEEILFFITIPYAIIFLYETAEAYLGELPVYLNKYIPFGLGLVLVGIVFFFPGKGYTQLALISVALFFFFSSIFYRDIFNKGSFLLIILLSYLPFFLVNYFLTSIPVISYGHDAILNIRISTIPIEDFFYSFSLLSFYLLFYIMSKEKWPKLLLQARE